MPHFPSVAAAIVVSVDLENGQRDMRPEMRRGKTAWRARDVAAAALAAVCGLNLNGLMSMLFDVGQVASNVVLVASIYLIVTCGRSARSWPTALLVAAIATYLLLGTLYHSPLLSIQEPDDFIKTYLSSVLIIVALTGYTASLSGGARVNRFLALVRNIFLVSAASVWASPFLYEIYVNTPPSADTRWGGFFGNPNEAAMASLIAVVLVLTVPFENRLLQWPLLLMASVAIVLTLSKTGMSALVIILAWYGVYHLRGGMYWLLPVFAALAVIAIQDIFLVFEAIAENPITEFNQAQKNRILAVGQILGGQIDENTTTGRTVLWTMALERGWENFPLGSGLGSAHHIIGGIFENGTWQGAHNTFVMLFDEAGPLPLGLLVASILTLLWRVRRNAENLLAPLILFVLVVDMTATHGALVTRYHNLIFALLAGLMTKRRTVRSVTRGRLLLRVLEEDAGQPVGQSEFISEKKLPLSPESAV